MPTTPTYDLIATTTLAASSSSVSFASVPQGYRDLVLVASTTTTGEDGIQVNGDTGSNYSTVQMRGNGSATGSVSFTDTLIAPSTQISVPSGTLKQWSIQIMDYSATDKHKTFLTRFGSASVQVQAQANRWANTSAITSIRIMNATYDAGSTFTLYGIAA